jgi:excisionase family DNA binding protein
MSDLDYLMKQKEAAELLGVSGRTLEGWRLHGGGPLYVKVGRSVRYRLSDLNAWIEQRVRTSTSDNGV